MFLNVVKLAATKAVKAGLGAIEGELPKVKYVGPEYPEQEVEWPAILIQFRPTRIEWTGVNPDWWYDDDEGVAHKIRPGDFDGNIDYTILALHSAERDRLWDGLVQLILMADVRTATNVFDYTLTHDEYAKMVPQRGTVQVIGDTIGVGTPWNPDLLSYEATVRQGLTGHFFADEYTRTLARLEDIERYPYIEDHEEPYGEDDGQGSWSDATGHQTDFFP